MKKRLVWWVGENWFNGIAVSSFLLVIIVILGGSRPVQWDILAFTGSIVGGLITWLGVRTTIIHTEKIVNRERREKAQESAAIKIRMLDKIEADLKEIERKLDFWVAQVIKNKKNEDSLYRVGYPRETMGEIEEIITRCVDQAVNIDAETYRTLVILERLIKDYKIREGIFLLTSQSSSKDEVRSLYQPLYKKIQSSETDVLERRSHYLDILFPEKPFSFVD